MNRNHISGWLLVLTAIFTSLVASAIEPSTTLTLWPGEPPGSSRARGEEKIVPNRPRPFYQLTDISKPTLGVFLPSKETQNRTALLVLPGGGLQRLAYEHEGLEVAEWAIQRGITAFLLKYRVPASANVAASDAQQAMKLIRSRAAEWNIDGNSIGVIGFSAGGELAAWMTTQCDAREYPAFSSAYHPSCRPDFAALIYPGGLIGRGGTIKEPIAGGIGTNSPPMFFVHAAKDASENSLAYALALKRARVPVELHLYRDGGHGFGMRPSGSPLGSWDDRFVDWMSSLGFMDRPLVRDYARNFAMALAAGGKLPAFPDGLNMSDAAQAQKRLVRNRERDDSIAGFKGGAITDEAQRNLGLEQPLTGVLFRSGWLKAEDKPVIDLRAAPDTVVETEIGYIIGVDISYDVLNSGQARDAVRSVVPVIELPVNYARRVGRNSALDMIASNVGSARYIVGAAKSPAEVRMDALKLRLERDGQALHEAGVDTIKSGQWENLRLLLNQITRAGYTIREGNLIISGAVGGPKPAQPGKHSADFGELGKIDFDIRE